MYKLQDINCAIDAKILAHTNIFELTMTVFYIIIIEAAAGISFPYRQYY